MSALVGYSDTRSILAFIDETGDHNLTKIDFQYPIFGLGALLIHEEEYLRLDSAVRELKREFFGDDGTFILHSSELKRPADARSDSRNACMLDSDIRRLFFAAFDERIVRAHNFSVIACFVRKPEMKRKYSYPIDPYHFSFENLLNRILKFGNGKVHMHAEQRGSELDAELVAEYERLTKVGIHFFNALTVRSRTQLCLVPKRDNMSGLQVIDLLLASLARAALGKEYKMLGNDPDPVLVRAKYACQPTFFPLGK